MGQFSLASAKTSHSTEPHTVLSRPVQALPSCQCPAVSIYTASPFAACPIQGQQRTQSRLQATVDRGLDTVSPVPALQFTPNHRPSYCPGHPVLGIAAHSVVVGCAALVRQPASQPASGRPFSGVAD